MRSVRLPRCRAPLRLVRLALAGFGLAAAVHIADLGQTAVAAPNDAGARCQALIARDFPDIVDAPARIDAAKVVAAEHGNPEFCEVRATVRPNVGIVLDLPTSTWNGKFFEYGRGGYCRPVTMEDCEAPVRKGYACVITDSGNKTKRQDDEWAHDDLKARVDCGFRGIHVAAQAGKAITGHYYAAAAWRSYFMGCSTGGRLAMVEAERFPYDFDGIIAGAPPVTKSGDALALLWNVVATLGPDGRSILAPDDVRLVARAALAHCDAADGLVDGIIGDPLHCRFDPAELECAGTKSAQCLTHRQVEAVRKIYQGPVNSEGVRLYPGSALPGSELNWIGTYIAPDGGPSGVHTSVLSLFRYLNIPDRGPGWRITDFNWDEDYKRLGMMAAFNSGADPDLRPFKAAGGKLLAFHGLADEAVIPAGFIDFHEAVERTLGGRDATRDFFRLFAVPGLNHCSGGTGATAIDYVSALEDWVEHGHAPDVLIGAHVKRSRAVGWGPEPLPVAPDNIGFTRPVFPYPLGTRYKGTGDPNDAANFESVAPSTS